MQRPRKYASSQTCHSPRSTIADDARSLKPVPVEIVDALAGGERASAETFLLVERHLRGSLAGDDDADEGRVTAMRVFFMDAPGSMDKRTPIFGIVPTTCAGGAPLTRVGRRVVLRQGAYLGSSITHIAAPALDRR